MATWKTRVGYLVMAWGLLGAGTALAGSLPFTGTLVIQLMTLDPLVVNGSGTAVVNGSGGGGHLTGLQLPASAFTTVGNTIPITDPAVIPINGLSLTAANGAASFAGNGGSGFGGAMAIYGTAKVCLYGSCAGPNNITNLSVPLDVIGVGGVAGGSMAVSLTVVGAPWTTGTVAVGAMTAMGGVSPLSNTGAVSGSISLVTPFYVVTHIGAYPVIPGIAFLDLHFVPEPGTLPLLSLGIAGLVALGRSRPTH